MEKTKDTSETTGTITKRQKSFSGPQPSLYLVPTPIGNLGEMSRRALEILGQADIIACEDTRNSGRLLQHFGISKPLISHHEHNQETSIPKIMTFLEEGKSVAVISDAGYPLVSDPGQRLVRSCISAGIPVIPVSGPNAALDALVASGMDTRHYLFYGFLDAKSSRRTRQLETLKSFPYTIIFYEAPHRIEAMLSDLYSVFGNRNICLARELTKLHEELIRGQVKDIIPLCAQLKGEMVVVCQGAPEEENTVTLEEAAEMAGQLKEDGLSTKQAVAQTAKQLGISKNELYRFVVNKER